MTAIVNNFRVKTMSLKFKKAINCSLKKNRAKLS
jgi:hypothetical protein